MRRKTSRCIGKKFSNGSSTSERPKAIHSPAATSKDSFTPMSFQRTLRLMTRYSAWANQLIFEAAGRLPAEEVTRPRTGPFKSIVHTLNHNYVIDQIFQAHLQGRPHGFSARNT